MSVKTSKRELTIAMQALLAVFYCLLASIGHAQLGPDRATTATLSDYTALPELLADGADPLLLIDLSVELTQQAESYTGATEVMAGGNVCPGRQNPGFGASAPSADICYTSAEEYIGYFDPGKCYLYSSAGDTESDQTSTSPHSTVNPEYFYPSSMANADYTCSGASEFSGNYMNWATMTAIDQFRYAMTGGARIVDTAGAGAQTLLTRTNRSSWRFVPKAINSTGLSGTVGTTTYTFTNRPNELTPFTTANLWAFSDNSSENRVEFFDGTTGTSIGSYSVIVQTCDRASGLSLEENCVEYSDGTNTWYKPEGLLLQNSLKMKYALFSYLADNSHTRNGGVLRVAAKYIGTQRPTADGGFEANPNAEVDANGLIVLDPDNLSGTAGVNNSGLLNYINNFGLGPNGYKGFDPVAELYYESLRYLVANDGFTQLSPTLEYYNNTTTAMLDNFPVITNWTDPITEDCQANYILYSGDQFAWEDHNLPGVASSIYDHGYNSGTAGDGIPNGGEGAPHQPTSTGIGIDAAAVTATVGSLEGYTGGAANLGLATRGRNNNGWWFAGLSYWANTTDIRPDRNEAQYVKTFVVDTQEYQSGGPGTGRSNPLWLGAKYGGFETSINDSDDNPNTQTVGGTTTTTNADWDADNDGVPDTYTLGNQPANMVAGLRTVFDEVNEGVSSGSAAAVQAGSSRGIGGFYQALYEPKIIVGSEAVEWTGSIHAWFIDRDGFYYEDTCNESLSTGPGNCDKVFTSADAQIRTRFGVDPADPSSSPQLLVDRYNHDGTGPIIESIPIRQLSSLWSAHDELSALSNVTSQRSYDTSAANGRYIFTWIDRDGDESVDEASEILDFSELTFTGSSAGNFERYLGLDTATMSIAPDLVNYIRGEDGAVSGWRSRTIDADGDGSTEVLRLGDIVHSSPLAVGIPSETFGVRYRDETYIAFQDHYRDRRVMIYAGANDGMLHAFNGGFYDIENNGYALTTSASPAPTSHPLGSEIWAYVPQNLLPHLRWLPRQDYSHVYYVDGEPKAFDVNIFPDDADHPGGWGTILVVGFRLGGGDQTIDPDSDTDADLSDDVTLRSAYVILDITNPENPPTLLAEFAAPDLGFTTSEPAVIKYREPFNGSFGSPSRNDWYLVLGSGPGGATAADKSNALGDLVSNQNARAYVLDLNSLTSSPQILNTGATNSFIGGLIAVDWNDDYADDALYFGTVGGTVASPDGSLMRLTGLNSSDFSTLLSGVSGKAFSHTPAIAKDGQNNHWVFAGTGRLLSASDLYTPGRQETFYAIKDTVDITGAPVSTSISSGDLDDISDIRVFNDGTITGPTDSSTVSIDGATVNTFAGLELALRSGSGWFRDFSPVGLRTTLQPAVVSGALFITTVIPDSTSSVCEVNGDSFIFLVDFTTGTPSPNANLGEDSSIQYPGTTDVNLLETYQQQQDTIVVGSTAMGEGVVVTADDGESSYVPGIFSSEGPGRISWREIFF